MEKIKENWLLIVILFIALLVMQSGVGNIPTMLGVASSKAYYAESDAMHASQAARGGYGSYDEDFAPDVEERKKTITASLSTEVENGEFNQAETELKNIIASSHSYLINENSNAHGEGKKRYYRGTYQIKVEVDKYTSVLEQLKGIGEVTSFHENEEDITGTYTNTEINLEIEKARLERYQKLYDESAELKDRIELEDRVFRQERTIKYLEDSLENMDKKVDYATLTVSLQEKQHSYANIIFVKFSDLVKTLVSSLNSLLYVLFGVLPWAIAIGIIYVIVKIVRKPKKK